MARPEGSSSALLEAEVSAAELGQIVGVSGRRIVQLRDEGRIPSIAGGRYRLGEAVAAYAAALRRAAGAEAPTDGTAATDVDRARVRLLTAQAEAREMLNVQMRAEMIPVGDLEVVAGALCDAVRRRVLGIPALAAPKLVGLGGLAEVRDVLTVIAHDVCADLARTEVVSMEPDDTGDV